MPLFESKDIVHADRTYFQQKLKGLDFYVVHKHSCCIFVIHKKIELHKLNIEASIAVYIVLNQEAQL